MWYLPEPINDLDLIDRVNRRRQAAMNAEDLVVDDHTECQEIKHVGEIMPHAGVAVFARAFRVEAVGLSDAAGFVVASNQMHAMGVS